MKRGNREKYCAAIIARGIKVSDLLFEFLFKSTVFQSVYTKGLNPFTAEDLFSEPGLLQLILKHVSGGTFRSKAAKLVVDLILLCREDDGKLSEIQRQLRDRRWLWTEMLLQMVKGVDSYTIEGFEFVCNFLADGVCSKEQLETIIRDIVADAIKDGIIGIKVSSDK